MKPIRECRDCGLRAYIEYDLKFFQKRKEAKHGYNNLCKHCANLKGRTKQKEYKETYQILKRYNTTREDYISKMSTSNCCQICGKKEQLCYDHDHNTDEFRGVLCRACNRSIGQLGDTMDALKKAYEYLKRYEEKE